MHHQRTEKNLLKISFLLIGGVSLRFVSLKQCKRLLTLLPLRSFPTFGNDERSPCDQVHSTALSWAIHCHDEQITRQIKIVQFFKTSKKQQSSVDSGKKKRFRSGSAGSVGSGGSAVRGSTF